MSPSDAPLLYCLPVVDEPAWSAPVSWAGPGFPPSNGAAPYADAPTAGHVPRRPSRSLWPVQADRFAVPVPYPSGKPVRHPPARHRLRFPAPNRVQTTVFLLCCGWDALWNIRSRPSAPYGTERLLFAVFPLHMRCRQALRQRSGPCPPFPCAAPAARKAPHPSAMSKARMPYIPPPLLFLQTVHGQQTSASRRFPAAKQLYAPAVLLCGCPSALLHPSQQTAVLRRHPQPGLLLRPAVYRFSAQRHSPGGAVPVRVDA